MTTEFTENKQHFKTVLSHAKEFYNQLSQIILHLKK